VSWEIQHFFQNIPHIPQILGGGDNKKSPQFFGDGGARTTPNFWSTQSLVDAPIVSHMSGTLLSFVTEVSQSPKLSQIST